MAKAKSNIFFCGNFVREADDSGILKCVAKYGNKLTSAEVPCFHKVKKHCFQTKWILARLFQDFSLKPHKIKHSGHRVLHRKSFHRPAAVTSTLAAKNVV